MSTVLNEEVTAQIWLRDYLAADATLGAYISGVWVKSVPIKEPLPVVLIDRQSGADINAMGVVRALSDELFLVRGVDHWTGSGQQDWTNLKAIADRLDVLLQRHTETTTAGLLVNVFRESTFIDEQSVSDGTVILHAGGSYRVKAQQTL